MSDRVRRFVAVGCVGVGVVLALAGCHREQAAGTKIPFSPLPQATPAVTVSR